jgi:hypothetical protein
VSAPEKHSVTGPRVHGKPRRRCSVPNGMVPTRRPQHGFRLSPTLAAARARLKAQEPTEEYRANAKTVSRMALVALIAAVAGFGVGQAASDGGSSIVISTSPSAAGEVAALRQYINRHGADRPVPAVPARAVTTTITTIPRQPHRGAHHQPGG